MPLKPKPAAAPIGRYQIALVYSLNDSNVVCYVVDTMTGAVKIVNGKQAVQFGIPFEQMTPVIK